MPAGSVVGTSSLRRQAFYWPFRIWRFCRYAGMFRHVWKNWHKAKWMRLSLAGLKRLDLESHVTCILEPSAFYRLCGQGIVGIETRSGTPMFCKCFLRFPVLIQHWLRLLSDAALQVLDGLVIPCRGLCRACGWTDDFAGCGCQTRWDRIFRGCGWRPCCDFGGCAHHGASRWTSLKAKITRGNFIRWCLWFWSRVRLNRLRICQAVVMDCGAEAFDLSDAEDCSPFFDPESFHLPDAVVVTSGQVFPGADFPESSIFPLLCRRCYVG